MYEDSIYQCPAAKHGFEFGYGPGYSQTKLTLLFRIKLI